MRAEEQALLARRMTDADSRGALMRWLAAALAWTVRMLNGAWRRSSAVEAEQRTSLDSLSQGVAVFDAEGWLAHRNHCFQVLLHLPPAMVRAGTSYAALADHANADGAAVLEPEDEAREQRQGTRDPGAFERAMPDGRIRGREGCHQHSGDEVKAN